MYGTLICVPNGTAALCTLSLFLSRALSLSFSLSRARSLSVLPSGENSKLEERRVVAVVAEDKMQTGQEEMQTQLQQMQQQLQTVQEELLAGMRALEKTKT
jgi:hypothetical protein